MDSRPTTWFITVMARDRAGIVAHLGRRIRGLDGNIVDLSQTVMRGVFTVLICARLPETVTAESISEALLDGMADLEVSLKSDPGLIPPPPTGPRFFLTARGPDRPGLVADLATFLAGRDVNIEDMYATSERADDGQFVMILQVRCPTGIDPRALQIDLVELADELSVTAHLQHENVFLATTEIGAVRTLSL